MQLEDMKNRVGSSSGEVSALQDEVKSTNSHGGTVAAAVGNILRLYLGVCRVEGEG